MIQFVFPGNDLRNNHLGPETQLWAGFSVEAHVRPYAHLSADGELVIGGSGQAAGSEPLAAADRSRGYALERHSQVIPEVQRWL